MSTHSPKARNRHPDTTRFERKRFSVSHITFEVAAHPKDGTTFALIAGEAARPDPRPLFTGHVTPGMAAELRALADEIERVEP
jgi:hypothetical protein